MVCAAATVGGASAAAADGGGGDTSDGRAAARAWNPFFAEQRPVAAVDPRHVVVLFDDPSLGEWQAAGSRTLGPAASKAWLVKARTVQDHRLEALAAAGVQFRIEHRYLRVANGVSVVVHGDGAQLLRSVKGVSQVAPVRTLWPATVTRPASAAAGAAKTTGSADARAATASRARGAAAATAARTAPAASRAASGAGVHVAVLDGIPDATHPALAGRVGVVWDSTTRDAAGSSSQAAASQPAAATPSVAADEHATEIASVVLRAAGARKAPVLIDPIRILQQQPDRDGVEALLGNSDDLLAGLEHAVDPDADGDTSDGADVALVASTTPFAGFASSPEARAVEGADALGTVVVAAAGNDGASGDSVGTVGSVAAATHALAVGAADLRGDVHAADVRVHGEGVDETVDAAPVLTASAAGATKLPDGELAVVAIDAAGGDVADYLDDDLRSRVGGSVALIGARDGVTAAQQIRAAADAGAVAVLFAAEGAAAAAGTVDATGADIPAVAISRSTGRDLAAALRDGTRLSVRLEATTTPNGSFGSVAGFSSGGPRLDGIGRPDVLAPGVGMVVAAAQGGWRVASGTSIAAAWAAGEVAAVRAHDPAADAGSVRSSLLSTAVPLGTDGHRPAVSAQGAGVIDAAAAMGATWASADGRIDFGTIAPGSQSRRPLGLHALDAAAAAAGIGDLRILVDDGGADSGITPALDGNDVVLAAPADAAGAHVGGWLVLPDLGVRIPWTATVREAARVTVPITATLSSDELRPVAGPGAVASTLDLGIGGTSAAAGALGLGAVEHLEVRLIDGSGADRGLLGGLDTALPGRYSFGLTGVDAAGKRMAAGKWTLRVRYVPAADPDGEWRTGPEVAFTVVASAKHAS